MRLTFGLIILFALFSQDAFALQAVICGNDTNGRITGCYAHSDPHDETKAVLGARDECFSHHPDGCIRVGPTTANQCLAVAISPENKNAFWGNANEAQDAQGTALQRCLLAANTCHIFSTFCETPSALPAMTPTILHFFDFGALGTGLSFGIGLIIALLIYAKRAAIANLIIHGRLPYKLPVYGEDIQSLFKFTQRENWYGRVIFGLVVNLAMNHQQLIDVRKYWLGKVIAFDSLRRQRQNQLAIMHLQLATKAKSEAHDKKKFWSRRWATFRSFTKKLFWVVIALFNLIMGLFFIRVTIAKLVRGTIVESRDLVLILQAKEAIEESTTYLKEYLTTANSFDGHDEVYDAG